MLRPPGLPAALGTAAEEGRYGVRPCPALRDGNGRRWPKAAEFSAKCCAGPRCTAMHPAHLEACAGGSGRDDHDHDHGFFSSDRCGPLGASLQPGGPRTHRRETFARSAGSVSSTVQRPVFAAEGLRLCRRLAAVPKACGCAEGLRLPFSSPGQAPLARFAVTVPVHRRPSGEGQSLAWSRPSRARGWVRFARRMARRGAAHHAGAREQCRPTAPRALLGLVGPCWACNREH